MATFIYADNAATTKLDKDAFEVMKPYLLDDFSNVSQPYSFSRHSKKAVQSAREDIAECIGAYPNEIFFTSCGTESDNWAIQGIHPTERQNEVITTSIEHHAVLNTCKKLCIGGISVKYMPVNSMGLVEEQTLLGLISEKTYLVSVMLSNNEIGTIQNITKFSHIAHANGAVFHTDAVQSVGHIPVDVKSLGVDLLSASAHKFNGPKGIGFLYVKNGTDIQPYMTGGGQELGLRAGTENVASIVGMAYALKKNVDNMTENINKISSLENEFLHLLDDTGLDYIRNGGSNHVPGNISLSFKGADGEMLLHRLDLMGIMVSTGAACDTKNTQISHVIKSIGVPEEYAKGTIRISLSKDNTIRDVETIVSCIYKILG